ncbi:DCC1-like thiol-disulfide oxidoreductase family protein [uncultured Tateyamaria sp.]|uniref:DCC1-like thiol-disulfide oxidoreductase family protein n=1 Tax=uncultured Tateyamaria sp. TaxID=455651 RepID=UPI00260C2880|nr:DCC1-like thiol-disulfide oxidoreductase family protein [uncultured Tateyamaria sp.]
MPDQIRIIYDGDCPFCSAYVKLVRLREVVGTIELIDARSDHEVIDRINAAGLDLDRGMAVEMGGQLQHGDAAMTTLAMMTTQSGVFNRIMRLMFSRPAIARILYPPLVAGRALTLRLLGRRKINH